MKKFIALATAASLLSLAACGDADNAAETETATAGTETMPIDSGAIDTATTGTTATTIGTNSTGDLNDDGINVGVDRNGVRADVRAEVRDGDTSVRVDADGNPSADIRID